MVALFFLLPGIFLWTFLEYIIHRFLGHQKRGRNVIRIEHQRHHAEAHYFAKIYKKIILAIIVLSVSTILIGLIFNWLEGFAFSSGFAGMYIIYEITHRRFHTKEPVIHYGLKMRIHHFYHHFGSPHFNHGVTTVLWDKVFGTYQKVSIVHVPQKMVMKWLIDDDMEIKKQYVNIFQLY